MSYSQQSHTIDDELQEVHQLLNKRYELKKSATKDIKRAEKMEKYLREFKSLQSITDESEKASMSFKLNTEAYKSISEQIGAALRVNNYKLFYNAHGTKGSRNRKIAQAAKASDIFEVELEALLNTALKNAMKNNREVIIKSSVAKIIGDIPGNVSSEFIQALKDNGQQIVDKTIGSSPLITEPQFRSAKTDISGYSANFDIVADIKPEWRDFIKTFTGVKCTLKNYSSRSKTEVLHLGKTVPAKAIGATLDDLNYSPKEAVHITRHIISSYESLLSGQSKNEIGTHILHLRFAYELTGGGLYDKSGQRLAAADFFIYNDPSSEKIWVRSTKAMIANAMEYMRPDYTNPLHSNIVILKMKFN